MEGILTVVLYVDIVLIPTVYIRLFLYILITTALYRPPPLCHDIA